MNIRKPTDYSTLFVELDTLMAAQLPQMELYREIGRVVGGRAEKGAAVAASEYLQAAYPAADGFSPRNLRRMRTFYAAYEESPEIICIWRCASAGRGMWRFWRDAAVTRNGRGTSVPCCVSAGKKRNYWNRSKRRHGCILLSTNRRFPAILVKMK